MLTQQRMIVAQARTSSMRTSTVCRAQSSRPAQCSSSLKDRLLGGLGAGVVAAGLVMAPMPAMAAQSLADLVRSDFAFVDANTDGIITQEELVGVSQRVSSEEELPMPSPEQLSFSARLFDLNMDGTLTSEEMLRAIALDGAVDDDAIDTDVFKVFDRDNNGTIDAGEFSQGLGDLGPHGRDLKDFVFKRTDQLSGSGGNLNVTDFGNALIAARTAILGY